MPKKAKKSHITRSLATALKEAALDPLKCKTLFKVLSHSKVVFGGFSVKEADPTAALQPVSEGGNADEAEKQKNPSVVRQPRLMCFQDTIDGKSGEMVEYAPFFSSPAQAKRLFSKMNLPWKSAPLREAPARQFFRLALDMNKVTRLNPGSDYSMLFSFEDMIKVLNLSPSGDEPVQTKNEEQFKKLKEEYSLAIGEKIAHCYQSNILPPTLAEAIDLAELCMDDQLVFHPNVKASIRQSSDFDKEENIKLIWRMFLSLAQVYHIMRFRQDIFSPTIFVKETGLALPPLDNLGLLQSVPEGCLALTDLLKRDIVLLFNVLENEEKLLVYDLEISPNRRIPEDNLSLG
ncbi:MAG: SseB family protein [Deltaproteobacteria bacterium]|nr:SseB family protein [Deltaproteobacteria bacterium]